MTPEERAEVSCLPDGARGWVTVPFQMDGGSMRLGDGEGDRIDWGAAQDVVLDLTTIEGS